ncbi:ABC transporter substrate-binding protein [Psychromonas ossibalaenae]|uniref:ABC transporter substrate-binding protein n=1 Tax=Psychromonas ossibalaenae TaxID=444922 RepID=UPI000364F1EB|nr:ABC transporter substrate-binding protein [Psychromonas ossibalaenae]
MSIFSSHIKLLSICLCSFLLLPLAANAELTLRMLTWEGYSPDLQVKAFEKAMTDKYGEKVSMEITYISSADEYFTNLRKGKVDIIVPSHNIILDERYKLVTKKLLIPIDLKNIPNYSKIIPSLQKADYAVKGGKLYSVPLVHGPYGLAYNSEKMTSPDSWNVLWDNQYKGKYTLSSDYSEVNIYVAALALGINKNDIANIERLSQPDVQQKLNQLIANASHMWKGVDAPEDLENNLLGAAWGFSFPELKQKGQHWAMAEPKEGTTGWVDGHSLSKTLSSKPKLKEIAEAWINYTISDGFQLDVIVHGIGSAPVNTAIKARMTAEEISAFHMDDPDYFKNNRILWPTLKVRQRNLLNQLWENALKAAK